MRHGNRVVILFASFILAQALVISATQIPIARANPVLDDPKNIHLTYQDDPASTITVTWQTIYPTSGDDVLYDDASHDGNPSLYKFQGSGSHHVLTGASVHIHDVEITGLAPDTVFYFICGGLGNYSNERAFRTAPKGTSEFRFVIGGDSRTNAVMRSEVSKAMSNFNPSFILHLGDMVEDGNSQAQWEEWFTDVNNNWIGANGLTIPVIPCLGNHESNSTKYYEQFTLSGNEQWYYFDWAPNLRIIVLSSQAFASQISGIEKAWLENALNSTPENMWKIVMFHRNVYYSGGDAAATDIQQQWVPIFDKYHVDLVLQGHTHHYHRTKPMNNGAVVYSYREGTIYLTAGGWGAPLHPYIPQSYSAYGLCDYHFVLASVFQNGSLHLEAKDLSGQTFDDFWLHSKLRYWDFPNGMYLMTQGANISQPPLLTNDNLTVNLSAPKGTTGSLRLYCAQRGSPLNATGASSWVYNNDTKMFTATVTCDNGSISLLISWVKLTEPESGSGSGSDSGSGSGSGSDGGPDSGGDSGSGGGSDSGDGSGEQPSRELAVTLIACSLGVLLILAIVLTFGSLIKRTGALEKPKLYV